MTTMRSAVALTAIGIASGLMAGAYLTRFVASQLYAIRPLDLPTFAGAAIVMLVAAGRGCVCAGPARRAGGSDDDPALRVNVESRHAYLMILTSGSRGDTATYALTRLSWPPGPTAATPNTKSSVDTLRSTCPVTLPMVC